MKLGKLLRSWKRVRSAVIRAEEYGENWPFVERITQGTLQRIPMKLGTMDVSEVLLVVGKQTYALNGIAKEKKKYIPVDEIWAPDPLDPALRKNLGPIIQRGLALK